MAGLRDVLFRFRPAGTPGAPTPGAVPRDRAAEADAEVAPVLAELAGTAAVEAALEQADHEDTVRRTAWAGPGRSTLPGPAGQGRD